MPFETLSEIIKITVLVVRCYIEAFASLFIKKNEVDLENKLILITGAGQGLGKELAIRFARFNSELALLDINKENLDKAKKYIEKNYHGIKVRIYVCDVSKEQDVIDCVNNVRKDFNKSISVLINNAGIVTCLPFENLDSKSIVRTFEVNVFSQFWTIKSVLPIMKRENHGQIIAIASIAGHIGNANLVDYCSSKFAIVGLMESLREELRQENYDGIKLTTINPISMNTTMFKSPKTRFSSILPVVDVSAVADRTVQAVLNQETSLSVPDYVLWFHRFSYFVPEKVKNIFFDFLDYNVKPHY